jgi:hypothetical protein
MSRTVTPRLWDSGAWVGLVQPDAMHLDSGTGQELVQAQAGDPSLAAERPSRPKKKGASFSRK